MSPERKPFRRIGPDLRREAMIAAMLAVIAEDGIAAATTRAVAARAGVTPGLIGHYFDSKDALIGAAYAHYMSDLTRATCGQEDGGSASARLASFVARGLRPPVASTRAVTQWAGFLTLVQQGGHMQDTHAATYAEFRDHLQGLIATALAEAGRPATPDALRRHAIACNALIDGLWLEGGLLPEAFGADELAQIGLASISAMLGLELTSEMIHDAEERKEDMP
ncbi:TetR family transcriptional regulator C-terminal domain-containing protein [Roseovarius dicentrarchi]|uniref:TetR family transcriptional regulator C-terminal domain-containing protein n=1 Tax=Roseovarius dicentrarchi TaxID=2250573 RepID=UPI000DE936BE|nr:TetR family transcriptional regulator C-terminal domain-containing protein [Roseovarius dicentrarchi]